MDQVNVNFLSKTKNQSKREKYHQMRNKQISLKIYIFYILIIAVIIFLLLILISCWGYRTFIFENAFIDCSFQYPSSQHVVSVDKADDGYSTIANVRIALWQQKTPQDEYINVSIRGKSSIFESFETLLEYDLDFVKKGQNVDEFILIDRTNTSIDGVVGETIVYSYFRHPEAKVENNKIVLPDKIPAVSYNVYFEKNGFICKINVEAVASSADQAKADFEQILVTFKFLD